MRAMLLDRQGAGAQLGLVHRQEPEPGPGEVLIGVGACALCRTDLHVIDGELREPRLPLVLGHQIVGKVLGVGEGADPGLLGRRVGVPWLGGTCTRDPCPACARGQENLCDRAVFTGYTRDGGLAERAVADARYCFAIDDRWDDAHAAPLLCAGLIGYRSLSMCGDAQRIGIYGFGAAAHLIAQVAVHRGRELAAFTRPGDERAQAFARELGARWAGGADEAPPWPLDAAIIFAPAGELVVSALAAVRKGGAVICGGIHMSDIPSFPYQLLWGERSLRSVANLTRRDGAEFLPLAAAAGVEPRITTYALGDANTALADLRGGRLDGAAVIVP